MKPAKVRAEAARILATLLNQNGSLATLLPRSDNSGSSEEGMALLRELCFGCCRRHQLLNFYLSQLLDKPLKAKDTDIQCLLLIGLYQLMFLRLPDYAAVNETVNATLVLKKAWAKNLVNGVLRQFQRQLAADSVPQPRDTAQQYSYPAWLCETLESAWPEHFPAVLEEGNRHPPMTLRVNLSRISRENYLSLLHEHNIEGRAGDLSVSAIYLAQPLPVSALPGFSDGLISVQDEASQLIPGLLMPAADQTVLDACAAPGGKTCHMLETQAALKMITALDIEARRLERLHENLDRLGLANSRVQVKIADATNLPAWWDGQPFDRILLDAPCSATGIIRRQPDVKILRQASDIPKLAALQANLLDALWTTLAPGGMLLYTTCSILPQENTEQVVAFLRRTPDAQAITIAVNDNRQATLIPCDPGIQLLPSAGGPDGFYYALLQKL